MNIDTMFRPLAHEELSGNGARQPRDWCPSIPVPAGAPDLDASTIARNAGDGFSYSTGWRYRDADGRLVGWVIRYDRPANGHAADKEVKPFTYCQCPDGRQEWRSKGFPEPRPLYGLDRIAARAEAKVLVVEGEKAADAAAKRFPEYVATTSPGGSNAAGKADWSSLKGRTVTIWPDADDAGARYADDVADAARRAGAASVHTVKLPLGLPHGWDLADDLPPPISEADIAEALSNAKPAAADGPIPLFPPVPLAERFPLEALGPVLSRAAAAISRKIQVPEAIAAQSVLAAAALASQAHADVMLPYGQKRPLSLFFVTVASSGDRKSTADNEALWPIRKREQVLKDEHDAAYKEWVIATSAYGAEKKKIEANKSLDFVGRKHALAALGPEPERPLHPFLTAPEPTIEGLVKAWAAAPPALGIFTSEGGQFVGGHGMLADNRLKTAASYSEIWDGQPIKRVRSLDGVSVLFGRRLSMHLMVQQEAAAQFLADPLLRDQGLLSRVLVAAPESIAGTRFYRETAPDDDSAIKAYGARILSILQSPWPMTQGSRIELEPRVLSITDEAASSWRSFYDHVERQCGPGNELRPIQDFAAKAAEHAARIAGVLTIVENHDADEIGTDAMHSALTLVDWYVAEAVRLQRAARTSPKLLLAQQLLDWLRQRDDDIVDFRDIIRLGPSPLRMKKPAEDALAVLTSHGWISEVSARPRRIRFVKEG